MVRESLRKNLPSPRAYCAMDLHDLELHPLGKGLAAVFTHRAPDSHSVNEDCAALLPFDQDSGVMVVADGAGGLPAGEKAAEIAVHSLRDAIRRAARSGLELRTAILDGIDHAHAAIMALGVGAGSTLAVAELRGRQVRSYHVGDSQIAVIGRYGKLKWLTPSHSPTGYAVAAGMLEETEAMQHEDRHLVSNLLGQAGMSIEVGPVLKLSTQDAVLVASDGLFDNLNLATIAEACRQIQVLAAADSLRCEATARMLGERQPSKPDDLTVLLWRLRSSL